MLIQEKAPIPRCIFFWVAWAVIFIFFSFRDTQLFSFLKKCPSLGVTVQIQHIHTIQCGYLRHNIYLLSPLPCLYIYRGCVCVYKLYPGMKASFIQAQTSNSVILVLTLLEAESITSHTRSKNFTCSIFLFLLFIKWKQCAEHNINKKSVLCLCLCPRHPEDLAFSNTRCQQCITNSFLFIYSYKFPLCATTAYTQVLSLESRRH